MLDLLFEEVYEKFKLNFYRSIFKGLQDREASLTATETFTVEVIYALKQPTINEVANFLELSQPNMAYRIGSLVKKGYVRKVQSQEDKREYHLQVTDKFHKYYQMKNQYIRTVLDRLAQRVPPADLDKLEEILELMSRELMPEVSDFVND